MYRSGSKIAEMDMNIEYLKPPILIGTNGKIFDPELNFGTIFGYSQTKLVAQGTLVLEGMTFSVQGFAWIDHQWGAWSYLNNEYWQIQMENGYDLAISRIYTSEGLVYDYFYKVGPSGEATDIDEYEFEDLKYLLSPSNNRRCVSSKWGLSSSSIDLITEIAVPYQFSAPLVWEGTITGAGTMDALFASGRGYAFLYNAPIADPAIGNVTHKYFDPGATTPVTADIMDGIPIVNATIYYNTSIDSTIKSVPMGFVSGYQWSGELPPQPFQFPNVTVYYYIEAFDLADKSVKSDVFEYYVE
jgi:hypothetical protein